MTTLLLGLGNRDRGDDAVGLQVSARVAAGLGLPLAAQGVVAASADAGRAHAPVTVATWSGPDLDLLDRWDGHDHVIMVDASRGAGAPGTRRRVVVDPRATAHVGHATGSHAMGLPRVIALGHVLGRLPARIELVTVEAGSVEPGAELTPAVASAADDLTDALVAEFEVPPRSPRPMEVDRVPG